MAADLFVVPTATFRLLFVLVILAHDRRRIVHVAVTDHPTAAWTAQQLRNAFSEKDAPKYLLHDRDSVFADVATTIAGMNTAAVRTRRARRFSELSVNGRARQGKYCRVTRREWVLARDAVVRYCRPTFR